MIKISDSKPYLIGEIGINHNGDMQIAKKISYSVASLESIINLIN